MRNRRGSASGGKPDVTSEGKHAGSMFRNRLWPAILCDRGFESLLDHAPYLGVVSAQVEYVMPSEEIEVLFTVNVIQIAALALGVDDVMADHLQSAGQRRIDVLGVQ